MSAFDELMAKLAEKNLDDNEVDKIVSAAESIASVLGLNDNEVVAKLEELKKQAEAKKQNKDIRHIGNVEDLRNAVNGYVERAGREGPNVSEEVDLSNYISIFSKEAGVDDFLDISNKLLDNQSVLVAGDENQKQCFGIFMDSAFYKKLEDIDDNDTKLSPEQTMKMLDTVSKFAMHASNPDEAFARVASNLDNKDVAKNFCAYTEKMLEEMGEKGAYIYNPNLIGVYAEIVEHHPEMAKTCNDLVNMVAELDGSPDGKVAGAAVEYFDKVDRTDGVDSCQKGLARIKSKSWRKRLEKMGEKERDDVGYQYEKAWHSHTTGGMEM